MNDDDDNESLEHDASQTGAAASSGGEVDSYRDETAGGGGDEAYVTAERKFSLSRGTLVMVGIIAIGAAGLWVMSKKAGPSSASAAVAPEATQANKTITSFLNGGDKSLKSMEVLLKNTQKVVAQFLAYPSMTQVPLADLRTNPFRQHDATLKPDTAGADAAASEAAERKKREDERQVILKSVQSLQLQSIVSSDARKACMINNTLYRESQLVDGFSIEKINPTSVVVKNGPYRFELRIQR